MRPGYVGTSIEDLEGKVADTVEIDISIRPEGSHVWESTKAAVTINGKRLPVGPGFISFEIPVHKVIDEAGMVVTSGVVSDEVDVVLRLRVKRDGLKVTYKRRDS